jgi:DNA-binding MarR family transcriptional regulator
MKYNINLNLLKMQEHGLNVNQWCILDIISTASTWCEIFTYRENHYYWISKNKICEELKALDLKTDTIYRHLKLLSELGFIDYVKDGKKDLVILTDLGKSLFFKNSEINPTKLGNKSELNSEINPTDNNTNIYNKTKNTYKLFLEYLKKECIYKSKVTETKEGMILFNQIEDKKQLALDYIKHQEEKGDYAVRITKYMEDYNTVYKNKSASTNSISDWSY